MFGIVELKERVGVVVHCGSRYFYASVAFLKLDIKKKGEEPRFLVLESFARKKNTTSWVSR